MKHPIAALFAILFLLSIAVVAYLLLTKPLAVAEFATRKGFVVVLSGINSSKMGENSGQVIWTCVPCREYFRNGVSCASVGTRALSSVRDADCVWIVAS